PIGLCGDYPIVSGRIAAIPVYWFRLISASRRRQASRRTGDGSVCTATRVCNPFRKATNNASVQMNETITHRESASERECFSTKAHKPATANMLPTDPIRLPHRGLLPPAKNESAANHVIVKVNTVVVRSCTTSLRTVAFRMPIANAVTQIKV